MRKNEKSKINSYIKLIRITTWAISNLATWLDNSLKILKEY